MRSPQRTSDVRYCISWMAKVRKRGKAVLFIAQKRHRSCLGLPKWSSCKNLLLEEVTNAWLKADSLRCSCGAALALRKGQRYPTPPHPAASPSVAATLGSRRALPAEVSSAVPGGCRRGARPQCARIAFRTAQRSAAGWVNAVEASGALLGVGFEGKLCGFSAFVQGFPGREKDVGFILYGWECSLAVAEEPRYLLASL